MSEAVSLLYTSLLPSCGLLHHLTLFSLDPKLDRMSGHVRSFLVQSRRARSFYVIKIAQRNTIVYYNLGLIFRALVLGCVGHDSIAKNTFNFELMCTLTFA